MASLFSNRLVRLAFAIVRGRAARPALVLLLLAMLYAPDRQPVLTANAYMLHSTSPSAGLAWAWGDNNYNDLGNGFDDCFPCTVPHQVSGIQGVTSVAAGSDFSLALTSDGSLWAWGANSSGELGTGTPDYDAHPTPTQIGGLSGIVAISASSGHSLALRSDGTVWAWGYNYFGQLGIGSVSTQGCYCVATPTQVISLTGVVAVAAGDSHSLALTSDGHVWAWGDDSSGQLGIVTSSSDTPIQVPGLRALPTS